MNKKQETSDIYVAESGFNVSNQTTNLIVDKMFQRIRTKEVQKKIGPYATHIHMNNILQTIQMPEVV